MRVLLLFFFNDTATTEIYTLSLHDALPIWPAPWAANSSAHSARYSVLLPGHWRRGGWRNGWRSSTEFARPRRSEEHTSELQSLAYLVCRLLLEKKKN